MSTIATRAKALVEASPRTQADIAASIEMKPDAFSRALNGSRGFGALELADLARELDADLHQLITGEPDPSRLLVSARHSYDHATGKRAVASLEQDRTVLESIRLVYKQADPVPPSPRLPGSGEEMRTALGPGFPRELGVQAESMGVDVLRLEEIGTAWSGSLLGRNLIVVPSSTNWFRQNWDLAHELGHLALGHPGTGLGEQPVAALESRANAFAADLLLPEDAVRAFAEDNPGPGDLASFLWTSGVSAAALSTRLNALRIGLPAETRNLLDGAKTQAILRAHGGFAHGPGELDPITARMEAANLRRFPAWLVNTHTERVAAGSLAKGSLAWMLGTPPEDLELDEPDREARLSVQELEDLLG
ncbi:ImmA/IrrE family metallo-endopeptidase [Arthrobacter sp. UM1]|uniref:ImmA/IrrE family metallo-endopeptidase n=1 Tax=Arthrobacter sp. UM1 TaxID=2766776 RepID=UPI001CF60602|nr:ImmA/IrrE family metallo-endopeptidase [Arthrobacter sp. UM1]MCB4209017.1 ImmA/IrrE family metallo-endopeptidase [Arthrobacter sp. UM1]